MKDTSNLQWLNSHEHSFTVLPQDCNPFQTLFGGKALSEMDLCAAALARCLTYSNDCEGAVTVKVDEVVFKEPGFVGDLIRMYAKVTNLGTSSATISVEVVREDLTGKLMSMLGATFTFVTVKDGKAHPHNRWLEAKLICGSRLL